MRFVCIRICVGLDNIYYLTSHKKYELRVVLEDFERKSVFAHYDSFAVDNESSGYQLSVGKFTDGGAGQGGTSECSGLSGSDALFVFLWFF